MRREDWALQACRLDSTSDAIWLNKVGTFGIASAGYWWSRLASGIGRASVYILGSLAAWVLLYADDLRITSSGSTKMEAILLTLLTWSVLGTSFSWGKCCGGVTVDPR